MLNIVLELRKLYSAHCHYNNLIEEKIVMYQEKNACQYR